MPGVIPDTVWLFRIVHINNVEYILRNGMFKYNHAQVDPNYINIGDSSLIAQRQTHRVGIRPPGGNLGDYVPFYFGTLSPMLLNIKTGYRGITRRPQSDIVYICCNLNDITNHCDEWCFTDGHAKNAFTEFYNDLEYLGEVDWNLRVERYWNNTDDDFDKMRRKQAEFLVKNHVPPICISRLVVYNEDASNNVKQIVNRVGIEIPVRINHNEQFYY